MHIFYFILFFTGLLPLTQLGFVDVKDRNMLLAIGSMCPMLSTVSFSNGICYYYNDGNREQYYFMGYDRPALAAEDIESILNEWPKVINDTVIYRSYIYSLTHFF